MSNNNNGDDLQSKASEFVKKILTVGIGTIFLTEESIRKLVTDFKLPKELLGGLLDSASKTKKDFIESFSKEIVAQLKTSVDPQKLTQELIENNEFEITIKVKPNKKQASLK